MANAALSEVEYAIEVNVTGAEPENGQMLISLFNASEDFLVTPLVQTIVPVDEQGNVSSSLGSHPPGYYAIAVVYDINKNGELDTGWFGIPKEEIGVSNNAKGRFGPSKWNDARFLLTDAPVKMEIQLAKAVP
ncbi:conserved hypothetical protein [Luminiphilus syltensis NOR5-1B]|uniref:DUF2141 domain-containing protein n=2 Tax=Luminiphilus TaxID=1341118 RepID=B8KVL1_9GAMM|nr:conserved hypothetical protein [Luminiphilus syltensis NOR5-1B]